MQLIGSIQWTYVYADQMAMRIGLNQTGQCGQLR